VPEKKQSHYYSGKKKRYTLKSQLVVNKANGQIICTSFSNGKRHDFRLFKEKLKICPKIQVIVDTGYMGIAVFHTNSVVPVKRSKKSRCLKR
jgi:hypothetical protein